MGCCSSQKAAEPKKVYVRSADELGQKDMFDFHVRSAESMKRSMMAKQSLLKKMLEQDKEIEVICQCLKRSRDQPGMLMFCSFLFLRIRLVMK